jgi:uncharacterized protein
MIKAIFINLPVKDLNKTIEFFLKLGLGFDQRFTDDKAACMIIGENIYAMLLTEEHFKSFIKTEISDARKDTEVLLALSVQSRVEVDDLLSKALEAGASEPRQAQDHGFMYTRNFQDIDGHIWEVFYMDESLIKK